MKRIDKISVGQVAELEHSLSSADIQRFVELTGDDNKLHTDADYAAQTSFKKPVVHGMLGASFISTIIGTRLPGDGALWFSQSLEFLLPVRIGDKITVRAEVTKKDERTGIIELQTDIFNQHRQKVTTGQAKVKVVEAEEPESKPSISRRKVALVAGGSGGIGSAVCHMLAADGFEVAVHYFRGEAAAKEIVAQIEARGQKAFIVQAEIENEVSVQQMVQQVERKYGAISVLVNCVSAKIIAVKPGDLAWQDYQTQFESSVKGLFHLVKAVVPAMEKSKYGKIINLGSMFVDYPANGQKLPYITAKSAVTGLTKALAFDLAPKGIRVNLVSPGMTETDLISDIPERVRLSVAARTPLRRLAKPEDVAGAVAFLASERSDYLAGETIRVNGGQVML